MRKAAHQSSHSFLDELTSTGQFPHEATDQTEGRHEPLTLVERTVPTDEYEAWLGKRSAQLPPTTVARQRRITRDGAEKTPWDAIVVKLTGEGF
jgi:hypothetical protein